MKANGVSDAMDQGKFVREIVATPMNREDESKRYGEPT